MSGKSRRARQKQLKVKKIKARATAPVVAGQRQAVARPSEPVYSPGVTAPVEKAPATAIAAAVTKYAYVTSELRTIGIMAGVILITLVVLSQVLS